MSIEERGGSSTKSRSSMLHWHTCFLMCFQLGVDDDEYVCLRVTMNYFLCFCASIEECGESSIKSRSSMRRV